MSAQKRMRACDHCHAIKIKCELGSTGGEPPCARCSRLNKDCVVTPPKRQKDRVAELEAKVQALTRLLEAQGLSPQEDDEDGADSGSDETALSPATTVTASKKRRLSDNARSSKIISQSIDPLSAVSYGSATMELDRIVPIETQARIYHRYVHEIVPRFPFVPIPSDQTLEVLRSTRPLLLQAIIYAACSGILSEESKDKVARLLLDDKASARIMVSEKSLELLQALSIATIWYWAPKHHCVAAWQLIPMMGDIATSLGLAGPGPASGPVQHCSGRTEDITIGDAWRAWAVCYLLSASWSMLLRKSNPLKWTEYHEICVSMLGYSLNALPSDRLVSQYIRGERLCEEIALALRFNDLEIALDVGDPATQATMRTLQNKILDRQAQIPTSLRRPEVMFWQQAASIYLHEVVLHTRTSKQAFSAPYLAERLSATDFPAPIITPEHVRSAKALKDACYSLLDTFCAFDTSLIMASGGMLFTPRALYAVFILIKLYIAATAHGNTLGTIQDLQYLQVKPYLRTLTAVGKRLRDVDPRAGPAVILSSTNRLEEWLDNYDAALFATASNDITQMVADFMPMPEQQQPQSQPQWMDGGAGYAWDETVFGDRSLDDLFAADLDLNWLLQSDGMSNLR